MNHTASRILKFVLSCFAFIAGLLGLIATISGKSGFDLLHLAARIALSYFIPLCWISAYFLMFTHELPINGKKFLLALSLSVFGAVPFWATTWVAQGSLPTDDDQLMFAVPSTVIGVTICLVGSYRLSRRLAEVTMD